MIKIIKIEPQGFASNSYLVTENQKDAILIDAALPSAIERAKRENLSVRYVLLTHGHFDHIGGCNAAQSVGAKIYCSEKEKEVIKKYNLAEEFSSFIPPFDVDGVLEEKQYDFCGVKVDVIFTPGHTSGGVSFKIGNNLFTGDALFFCGMGRTDFPTGNAQELKDSLKKLFALRGDYNVFPGHGEETMLSYERRRNS